MKFSTWNKIGKNLFMSWSLINNIFLKNKLFLFNFLLFYLPINVVLFMYMLMKN